MRKDNGSVVPNSVFQQVGSPNNQNDNIPHIDRAEGPYCPPSIPFIWGTYGLDFIGCRVSGFRGFSNPVLPNLTSHLPSPETDPSTASHPFTMDRQGRTAGLQFEGKVLAESNS